MIRNQSNPKHQLTKLITRGFAAFALPVAAIAGTSMVATIKETPMSVHGDLPGYLFFVMAAVALCGIIQSFAVCRAIGLVRANPELDTVASYLVLTFLGLSAISCVLPAVLALSAAALGSY